MLEKVNLPVPPCFATVVTLSPIKINQCNTRAQIALAYRAFGPRPRSP